MLSFLDKNYVLCCLLLFFFLHFFLILIVDLLCKSVDTYYFKER